MEIVRCARAISSRYVISITEKRFALRQNPFARERALLESPKLIIEWDGEIPTSAMCSACRAIFPHVRGEETPRPRAIAPNRV
jgi:hypothetical protein